MSPRVILLVLAQAAALAAVGAAVVTPVRRWLTRGDDAVRWGASQRAALALPGAVVFATLMFLVNLVPGGWVLGNRYVVPVLALAVVALAARRGPRGLDRGAIRWGRLGLVALLGAVLLALYAGPALVAGSSVRTGDPPWHMGWTEQLLGGQRLPEGPAPEFARNAYPWGYQAVLATMVRLVPGSDPLIAQEAMHLVIMVALPLAAAALARSLDRRAAWPAALAVSLIGGWGWIEARAPTFFPSPRHAQLGADLVVASPNGVYQMFPPAFPRELGLVVLAVAGVLLIDAARRAPARRAPARRAPPAPGPGLIAGACVGLAGLVSVPMFVAGLAWIVAASLTAPGHRIRRLLLQGSIASAVVGLWAVPTVVGYIRYGGFLDVTPQLGREWPLATSLGSWGVLGPAALVGVVVAVRRAERPGRVIAAYAAATAALLGLAILRGAYDWDLAGNPTLLHQGRVWPVAHLLAAVLTGLCAVYVYEVISRRSKQLAAAALGVIAALAVVSPVLASVQLTRFMQEERFGFIYSRPDVHSEDGFLQSAADHLEPDDVVLVESSDRLAFLLFQFSGARLARYEDPDLPDNPLRIRFAEPARDWARQMDATGFHPTFTARRASDASTREAVASGSFEGEEWVLVPGE